MEDSFNFVSNVLEVGVDGFYDTSITIFENIQKSSSGLQGFKTSQKSRDPEVQRSIYDLTILLTIVPLSVLILMK